MRRLPFVIAEWVLMSCVVVFGLVLVVVTMIHLAISAPDVFRGVSRIHSNIAPPQHFLFKVQIITSLVVMCSLVLLWMLNWISNLVGPRSKPLKRGTDYKVAPTCLHSGTSIGTEGIVPLLDIQEDYKECQERVCSTTPSE